MSVTWTLPGRLRALAATPGGRGGVVADDRALPWAELDRLADAVARQAGAAGAGPDSLVAIETADVPWAIAAIAGVIRAGAVAAPLPAGLTAAERARALGALRPAVILHADVAAAAGQALLGADGGPPEVEPDPEAAAVVVLSSGTSGRPNAVVLSHRALAASASSWLAFLPPATGWLLAVGLAHVAGLGVTWRAIDRGVPIRVAPPADPEAILAALASDATISHVSLVPAQLERLLSRGAAAPSHLRAVLLGGGPVPAALVTRAIAAGWPVVPTYGLTEAGSGVTGLAASEALSAPGSAGRPLPGVTVAIADADAEGIGEIVVTTPARSSGYLGEPSVDAATPLRTGDLGRLDDAGRLVVVDRRADRIVRGGENVDPAEVEAVLEAHPALAEAVVVGRPDPQWGHVPVAAVVTRPGAEVPSLEALAAHVRASLAGYKVPVAVHRLDALPRTAGGKLRREAVRGLLAGASEGELARPGGGSIGWRVTLPASPTGNGGADGVARGDGSDPPARALVLLPGTLSSAAQLGRLADALAAEGGWVVHALDRRGAATAHPGGGRRALPVAMATHVGDVLAYLDARSLDRVAVVGVSYGGVIAVELAARHPERVAALVAWEPPYGPLADAATRGRFERLAAAVADAHAAHGPSAAAETFLRAVAGDAAWDRLGPRAREALGREGDRALSDAALLGLGPEGLGGITAPTTLLLGSRSEPFYAPIAHALARSIPGASLRTLEGLRHPAPITDPAPVAAAIRDALHAVANVDQGGPS